MQQTKAASFSKPAVSAPDVYHFFFSGSAWRVFALMIRNLLFSIFTLGVYSFWGKTALRRYYWSHVYLLKEPFCYHGSGKELFNSAFRFSLIFLLPSALFITVGDLFFEHTDFQFVQRGLHLLVFLAFVTVYFYAKFAGLRYRLNRTSWRGICFELQGSSKDYLRLKIKNFILNILTLGLYLPIGDVAITSFVVNKMRYGNVPFRYNGKPEELQSYYYLCWLLIAPTAGLSLLAYRAKYYAHIAKYTHLGPVQFRCKITNKEMYFLVVSSFFLALFSFGFAMGFVKTRAIRFFCEHVKLRGELDYAAVKQIDLSRAATGNEGMSLQLGLSDIGDIGF